MKKIIALFMVLLATSASAEICNSTLKDRNGWTLRTFSGFGYSKVEACNQARSECMWEKDRLSYDRRYRGAYCTVENDWNTNPRRNCQFEMTTRRGRVIDSFTATANTQQRACRQAERQCNNALWARQSQGRNPYATCKRVGFGGGDHDRRITESCTIKRIGPRGRTIQHHYETATARTSYEAKQRACEKARRSCGMASNHRQSCVATNDSFDFINF